MYKVHLFWRLASVALGVTAFWMLTAPLYERFIETLSIVSEAMR